MDKQLMQRLNRAVDRLPQPDAQALWHTPVPRMEVHDAVTMPPRTPPPRRRGPGGRMLLAFVCLAVVVLGGLLWYRSAGRIQAAITLDINPSFSILVGPRGVRSVTGGNQEAETLLEGRDYRGWTAEDTAADLLRAASDGGYLTPGTETTVLVSVAARDGDDAALLAGQLSRRIRDELDSAQTPLTVLRQSFELGDDEEDGTGRRRLILLLADELETSPERLSALSLEELGRLALTVDEDELSVDRSAWLSSSEGESASPSVPHTPSHGPREDWDDEDDDKEDEDKDDDEDD